MKIARFTADGETRLGLVTGASIVDLAQALPDLPRDLRAVLGASERWSRRLAEVRTEAWPTLPLERVVLEAPLPDPANFLAVGLNYAGHARELGLSLPQAPRIFAKLRGSIVGPHASVCHPGHSNTLDYEGELCVVIGTRCRDVPRARAREVIAGYMVVDDLGLREFVNPDTVVLAKGCDGFGVTGPWLTTADEIADPHALRLRTWVNDELRQDSNTADLIFDCAALVEWCTRGITLEPGDLITTGSPSGSGHALSPPRYLRAGDRVRVEIDGLGALEHSIA